MEDHKPAVTTLEGEEHVIAAAQHLMRALGAHKNLTDDMRKILADLDTRLSSMTILTEGKRGKISEIEERLKFVQDKIMSRESDQSMIWDTGTDEASEYLKAVDEVRRLTESLDCMSCENGKENELLCRAHSILQKAMARLEEEFSYILVQNRQPFEREHMSFRSSEDDAVDAYSTFSVEDDSVEATLQVDGGGRGCEEFIIDLVRPEVITDLKCIANAMFTSNYDQECCQAFIGIRKDALDECLGILEVEKLSIEDVLRMEWSTLNRKIKKWNRAMKIFVRVYLASEKWLCEQIFGEFGSVNPDCFIEASKASLLRLLNFGDAIAVGPRQPEKLFCILDMYEVLDDLLPDICTLLSGEAGSSLIIECHEVLGRLGDSVIATFVEFKNAVASNISTNPFAGGGIHPLTKYVMNYIKALTDYRDTLNFLLQNHDGQDFVALLPKMNPVLEEETENESSFCISPMAHHLRLVTSNLESNLDGKSKLYRDLSLQHFFMMNNIYYMVQKVKGSELRLVFGDDWIRKHNGKFQQHAMTYERATWSSMLSLLKDEGIFLPGSNSVSKTILKERFRCFALAFEEVYRSQTGWLIPDLQLREDLRISSSLKVLQAYRTFMGRHNNVICDKYIKYSPDDLQNYLLDLFEGSSRSLHNSRKR